MLFGTRMTKSEISIWCLCFGVIGLLFVLDGRHPSVALKEEKLASSEPLEDMNCPDISVTLGIAGAREGYKQYIIGIDECSGNRGEKAYAR